MVLKYWNIMRRRLTIALNMLIMAKYFVGLKWWHQKAVTGKSLVMKIKKSVLYLLFFFVGWTESSRRAVKDLWIKMTFYPCQTRTLAVLSPTSFRRSGRARNIIARWRPKLWRSVFDMLSVKDVIIILTGNVLFTTSRLLLPLFLGYLVSELMSTEAENTFRLYACALAMCLNGLIGGLGMHQQDYRCEILGVKMGSALRGLVYHKVGTILKSILCIFWGLNKFF